MYIAELQYASFFSQVRRVFSPSMPALHFSLAGLPTMPVSEPGELPSSLTFFCLPSLPSRPLAAVPASTCREHLPLPASSAPLFSCLCSVCPAQPLHLSATYLPYIYLLPVPGRRLGEFLCLACCAVLPVRFSSGVPGRTPSGIVSTFSYLRLAGTRACCLCFLLTLHPTVHLSLPCLPYLPSWLCLCAFCHLLFRRLCWKEAHWANLFCH